MNLPAGCSGPVLEPTPYGLDPRSCDACDVTWWGEADDHCWCCGDLGRPGLLRIVTGRDNGAGATHYRRRWLL